MKIKTIGACLIVSFLAVLLLSNTVSAEEDGPVGPPIGGVAVAFDPDVIYPDTYVAFIVTWWLNEGYSYSGPFEIKMTLMKEGEEYWETPKDYYVDGRLFETFEDIFIEEGNYILEVQVTAIEFDDTRTGRYSLVASAEEPVTPIPEFTTIAIPVAAILGLFFFNHRKRRKK